VRRTTEINLYTESISAARIFLSAEHLAPKLRPIKVFKVLQRMP
jgi:hypothetical protein